VEVREALLPHGHHGWGPMDGDAGGDVEAGDAECAEHWHRGDARGDGLPAPGAGPGGAGDVRERAGSECRSGLGPGRGLRAGRRARY
jgi:hypothetical protein